MYRFKVDDVGKNKRISLFSGNIFCSVCVLRPECFHEIGATKTAMVKYHRRKVKYGFR